MSNLRNLEVLRLDNNPLTGALPDALTGLGNLGRLYLGNTQLCVPTTTAFQRWLRGVAYKEGVVNCTERYILTALYNATDGPNWTNNTNWLSDRPLGEWYGVVTDDDGRVTALELRSNRLRGSIPSELGNLRKPATAVASEQPVNGRASV